MFDQLARINDRPAPFSVYTAQDLWTDPHRASQMLAYHLNDTLDVSSRNTRFIDASAEWIIDRFDLGPTKSVCDFGCGPGLYTSRFAKSGANVTGLDFSTSSIEYARTQATQAQQPITYIQTDYLKFSQPNGFDLVTLIMCDYCALSPVQRHQLLGVIHRSLKDGGAVLLDVYAMPAFAAQAEASYYEKNQLDHFWYAEDYFAFVNTFKYEAEAVCLDKYSLFPETGTPETIYNWLQYFTPEALNAELTAAGFAPEALFQNVAGAPFENDHSEFAVVARKPGTLHPTPR